MWCFDRAIERALWGSMFYNNDFKSNISIRLQGTDAHTRQVSITYNEEIRRIGSSGRQGERSAVAFVWRGRNNREIFRAAPRIVDDRIDVPVGPDSGIESAFF